MKKLLVATLLCVTLVGCNKKETIELPKIVPSTDSMELPTIVNTEATEVAETESAPFTKPETDEDLDNFYYRINHASRLRLAVNGEEKLTMYCDMESCSIYANGYGCYFADSGETFTQGPDGIWHQCHEVDALPISAEEIGMLFATFLVQTQSTQLDKIDGYGYIYNADSFSIYIDLQTLEITSVNDNGTFTALIDSNVPDEYPITVDDAVEISEAEHVKLHNDFTTAMQGIMALFE